MKKILFLIILVLPACTSTPLRNNRPLPSDKVEPALVINPVDNWDYPGKFYPVSGEHLANFFNYGTEVSHCQLQTLNDIAVANIQSFMDGRKIIVEEKRNFIQFAIKPGSAWLLIKNQDPEVALRECLKLQKYLLDTFDFTVKK